MTTPVSLSSSSVVPPVEIKGQPAPSEVKSVSNSLSSNQRGIEEVTALFLDAIQKNGYVEAASKFLRPEGSQRRAYLSVSKDGIRLLVVPVDENESGRDIPTRIKKIASALYNKPVVSFSLFTTGARYDSQSSDSEVLKKMLLLSDDTIHFRPKFA